MKKNRIASFILAGALAIGGLGLVGCGDKKPNEYAYKQLSELTQSMKEETGLFKSGTVKGVATDFIISPLDDDISGYYNQLFVIPVEYIRKNIDSVTDIKVTGQSQNALDKLNSSVEKLLVSYDVIKNQYDNYMTFKASGDSDVAVGSLMQFASASSRFIGNMYDCAINLASLQVTLGEFEGMKTSLITVEDTAKLRDYLSLNIGRDYYRLLLESSNAKTFTVNDDGELTDITSFVNFVDGSKRDLADFVTNFVAVDTTGLNVLQSPWEQEGVYNNETITLLLNSEKNMNAERVNLGKSFDKFSLYNFYQFYNCNLTSYSYDVKYADIYYNEIQAYYNNFIKLETEFFQQYIVR